MEFKWTNGSKKVFELLKKRIIKNFEEKDIKRITLKYTKKKEFLAVPIPYTNPAFQLFIQNKFYKSYFLKNKKWEEVSK